MDTLGCGPSLERTRGSLQLRLFKEMESAERYQRPALPEAGGLVSQPCRRVLQHTLAPTAGVVKASHRRHCRNSCSY